MNFMHYVDRENYAWLENQKYGLGPYKYNPPSLPDASELNVIGNSFFVCDRLSF